MEARHVHCLKDSSVARVQEADRAARELLAQLYAEEHQRASSATKRAPARPKSAAPAAAEPVSTRKLCAQCGSSKGKGGFTNTQWKKDPRKCLECTGIGVVATPSAAATDTADVVTTPDAVAPAAAPRAMRALSAPPPDLQALSDEAFESMLTRFRW